MDNIDTILLIDDDPGIHMVVDLPFEESPTQLISCHSGLEAIEQAAHCTPQLILQDRIMPNMSGVETIKQLKMFEHLSSIPIILMTATIDEQASEESQGVGALGIIKKPFDPNTLIDQINHLYKNRNLQSCWLNQRKK